MPRVPLPGIPEDVPARAEYVPHGPGHHRADRPRGEPDAGQPARPAPAPPRRADPGRGGGRAGRRRADRVVPVGAQPVLRRRGRRPGRRLPRSRRVRPRASSCPASRRAPANPASTAASPLMVEDLVPAARDQVVAGIQAGTLDDARAVIARLAGQMLPVCPTVIDADHRPWSANHSVVPTQRLPTQRARRAPPRSLRRPPPARCPAPPSDPRHRLRAHRRAVADQIPNCTDRLVSR